MFLVLKFKIWILLGLMRLFLYSLLTCAFLALFLMNSFHLSHAPDKLLVISKDGASGDYPSCTDLAYMHAIEDGVDVLDCSVQMSKDGVPFCLSSINLIDSTTVAQSSFTNYTMDVPKIKVGSGIYTFNLTWDQITTLTCKLKLNLLLLHISLFKNHRTFYF